MITNTTKNATESFGHALEVLDSTLRTVLAGMKNLEKKNMTKLQSYKNLVTRYNQLVHKRNELLELQTQTDIATTDTTEDFKIFEFNDENVEDEEIINKENGTSWTIGF